MVCSTIVLGKIPVFGEVQIHSRKISKQVDKARKPHK